MTAALVVLAVAGAVAVVVGVWMIYPPAGLIAAGAFALTAGLLTEDGADATPD